MINGKICVVLSKEREEWQLLLYKNLPVLNKSKRMALFLRT